ncbi:MAG TPA: DNA polymerase III subunit alpha [Candidatus Omnitrophota bacterium]|nr:DNA polymerase III subunit alpha [Candidatus Omnitrophota bacterium]HPT07862.1 DNA polymerase III subunit alpha [Candidatus Omnitrophota bacterium]
MHSDFIHLHLHTQYSLLDGACRIPETLALARAYKMDSLAITDHGNMFGAIEFYLEAQKAGIKPIIGCEVYVAPGSRLEKSGRATEDVSSYHLILLARDETGYQNLMKLVSSAYLEGFYYKPRIDKEILARHAQGLLGLSACLKGEIPFLLRQRRYNDALKATDEFCQILGKENFYLEVQENNIPEQSLVNEGLLKISKELTLPLVATNDVHYLTRQAAKSHEALLCIQTQTTLDDPNRMRMSSEEFYFKSPAEMQALFKDYPNAISNTQEIASRCNLELEFGKHRLPRYEPPVGITKEDYLHQLCEDGLKRRFETITPEITARLEYEFNLIKTMGFVSYFLIVWDFIHYAKSQCIPVGPGRGSAAGSIVSYLIGITDINPLRYGLLFERFLNPERISMPDIDIDFCYERRQEVIAYVTQKYGRENVAQIITFGTMQARGVVRDVGRVMGMPYADVDRIAKLIPPDLDMTLKKALEQEKELKGLYQSDAQVKQLINTGLDLEGLNRHASVHAAGVLIADKPLQEYSPLYKTNDDQITTGYSMGSLEKIGLLKVDFLGLRTLTVIDQTLRHIKAKQGKVLDLETVPLDDVATYKLLASGQTIGVFQVESTGMRDLLRKLEPERFEDIIALIALYRPGPLNSGMVDDFIKRKHGTVPIRYDHPKLETVLKETYGVMVYQEQVMQITSLLAGFTLAQADLLRKAMGKKIPEIMEKQRSIFINGAVKNGIRELVATKIFDQIEKFAEYGFNKSHSAAYAVISYRTAYLKANYPVEFMTALLTSERGNTDKVVEYVNEAGRMGIDVLPPTVNESNELFSVVDPRHIGFGLLAVKNVGEQAAESIVRQRTIKKFSSLKDFCTRVDLRQANKKVLESLIKCGAMDEFQMPRARMLAGLEAVMEQSQKEQKDRMSGQMSFFDLSNTVQTGFTGMPQTLPDVHEWPEPQMLAFEKEMLGFYVTGHPLARYANHLKRFASTTTSRLPTHTNGEEIKIVGLIVKIKNTLTRAKQEKMAILKIEDLEGSVEAIAFPAAYAKISRYISMSAVVLVTGTLNLEEESPKIFVNDMLPMDEIYRSIKSISINLSGVRENLFESLKTLLADNRGKIPVYLHLDTPSKSRVQMVVGDGFYINPNEQLILDVEALLGAERLTVVI